MLKNLIKIELHKAFKNKWFLFALACAMTLALSSAYIMLKISAKGVASWELLKDEAGNLVKSPHYNIETLYNSWIGAEFSSWASSLFFFLFPLLASLPYGWSMASEYRSGYVKNIFTRNKRRRYVFSKFFAGFLSGGCVVAIPMMVNFLIVACSIPARHPEPCEGVFYGVFGGSMWSELFYSYPLVYDIAYIILNFIVSGLLATIPLSVGVFIHSPIKSITIPFVALLAFHYVTTDLLAWELRVGISPMHYVRATDMQYPSNIWIIMLELALIVSFGFFSAERSIRADVF